MSVEDKLALSILEKTIRHTRERYEFGFMCKSDQIKLLLNKESALRKFYSLERKWRRDPVYAAAYASVFGEYISTKHPVLILNRDQFQSGAANYLCHHGVSSPNKPGMIRVLFNPSSNHQGNCLNDHSFK